MASFLQRITLKVDITAAHYGYFEIELCPQETETDNCFQKLPIISGSKPLRQGTLCVGIDSQLMSADVELPAGVTCRRCTLRWTWRTSYGAVQGDPGLLLTILLKLSLLTTRFLRLGPML